MDALLVLRHFLRKGKQLAPAWPKAVCPHTPRRHDVALDLMSSRMISDPCIDDLVTRSAIQAQ